MEPIPIIDERQDIQKKTFTKWINSHLTKTNTPHVKDLFVDLKDGHKLLVLLGTLTNTQLKPEKGRMRVHHINNLNKVLKVLQEQGIRLVNISSDDIVEGNPKLTLGLVWLIASSFNGQLVNTRTSNGIEKNLLNWVKQFTEPHDLAINDFSTSWSDGRAFLFILHENIPKFDLTNALKKHPNFRLKLAFDLADRYLNIEQLLDPEDVNTNKPDKKSILMYVMCLYHAIESKKSNENIPNVVQHSESFEQIIPSESNNSVQEKLPKDEIDNLISYDPGKSTACHPGNVTDLDEILLEKDLRDGIERQLARSETFTVMKIDQPASTFVDITFDDSSASDFLSIPDKSRPLSTATNASIEINSYQAALESVLALLLEDEEILSRDVEEPVDFTTAKQKFHENEHFMLKLTEHQQFVGEALEEGSNLISESQRTSGLSQEDQNEIRQQMVLLNERWETLRVRALDVQSRILNCLAEFQTEQIEKLRIFLTNAEDRISRMSDFGPTLQDIDKQTEDLNVLRTDLKQQQNLVDALSNMVVIVNDESGNFCDLEDKLTALGERWSHVIKWNEIRSEKLHQYKIIMQWMDAREKDLKTMESIELQEIGSITRRMNDLGYCDSDLNELQRYLEDLKQMIESSMQENSDDNDNALVQIENLEDRLDALKQIVDIQMRRIEHMGFKFAKKIDEKRIERPQSWVDYQMIIKFGEHYDDPELSPQSNKKRKLQKSEKHYILEGKILEAFNFLENLEEKSKFLQRQSLRNQSEILEAVEKEWKHKHNLPSELNILLKQCLIEDSVQNLNLEDTQVNQICQRYEEMGENLEQQKTEISHLIAKEKFYKSLTGFKLVLADSRDWYKQHANNATKKDLENRLNDMDSLSKEISDAKEITSTLTEIEWKNDFQIFYESWIDMKRAILSLIHEKWGEPDESNQKLKLLQDFIAEVDNVNVVVADSIKMNANLNKLNVLKLKCQDLQEDFNYIVEKNDTTLIKDFIEIWAKLPDLINERIIKQNTSIENLNHFETEYENIFQNLQNLETTLKTDPFVLGEIKLLQQQTHEYDEHATELKKIEIDVISSRNFSEILIKSADQQHKDYLNEKVKKLNDYYTKVLDQYHQNSKKLHQILQKTEEILQRVHNTELWLNDLEMNTPRNRNDEISNSNELFQIKSKFQILKETCEKETVRFRELNEAGSDILLQIHELMTQKQKSENKYTYLTMKFTRLNSRWNDVTSLVYNRTAILEHVSSQLGELKKLTVSETGYLDKLEKKLRESPENAADAEEIMEELDDLENNLRNHSDERLEKIQEIGAELIELGFMKEVIQKEVDSLIERWNHLERKAKKRTEILEMEVSQAEKSEECVSKLEKWLTRVDEQLSEHLENDVTIEDLPHDFQRLQDEFLESEKNLCDVHELIERYMKKGNNEAANRLKEQLSLLEDRYKNCQMKLNKCTAPQAAYESRLSRALAELRNIERTTLVLDVASAGPSTVQDQYQHCLKIYRKLSEIKSDIETTIKTGRKVCEDKFTKDPKHLSQRIDALKHLYNALGENVTQSKISLESLLKLAKQMNEYYELAETLLRVLDQNYSANKTEKFQQIEDALDQCELLYDQYSNQCEPIYMEDVRQKIDSLKKKYLKLSSVDVIKRLNEMKSTLQNLDNISIETLRTMEKDLERINVSDPEIETLHSQVIGIVKDEMKKRSAFEDDNTEIVVVSDTVRQRRARTPSTNSPVEKSAIETGVNQESDRLQQNSQLNPNVLPDLLPKTFHLAESSLLFSQVSNSNNNGPIAFDVISTQNENDNERLQSNVAVVEVVEKNLNNEVMSVQNIEFTQPKVGEIHTVNILECVESFEPEYVETVQIIDVSEDDMDSTINDVDVDKNTSSVSTVDSLAEYDSEKELESFNDDCLRPEEVLKVERHRISFDEKRKTIDNERDILRDSEEDLLAETLNITIPPKKPKRLKYLLDKERDSFYNSDKESFDEPLVFSDDEDTVKFLHSQRDMSRIESPNSKKSNFSKLQTSSASQNEIPLLLDNSNITLTSPKYELSRNSSSLEQRVQEFDKTAKYMIRKLEATKEKISSSKENNLTIENLKLTIAPDAATLISQGDTLVLETHGKPGNLSKIVMRAQTLLRERFREVQQANLPKLSTSVELVKQLPLDYSDSQLSLSMGKLHNDEIDINELVTKACKRVYDLIDKPLDRHSERDLKKRILDINDRKDDIKLAFNAINKASTKFKETTDALDTAKKDLLSHSDSVETSLSNLQLIEEPINQINTMVTRGENLNLIEKAPVDKKGESKPNKSKEIYVPGSFLAKQKQKPKIFSSALAGSFDKSVLQISDWLTLERNMIKVQSISVDDVDAIRIAIEKQKNVLRELEVKKPQLNELVHTAETLKVDVNRQQLQEKGQNTFYYKVENITFQYFNKQKSEKHLKKWMK